MAKQQPEITVHMQEDLLRKLLYVANAEGRSPNNHLIMLLRNNVQYFERAKGRIPADKLRDIDLSAYLPKVDEE